MSICADKDWNNMRLVKYPPEPRREETFNFKEVRVVNGIIRGKVYDLDGNFLTHLSGTCTPFDSQEYMTQINFVFTVLGTSGRYVDICLSGLGIQLPGQQPVFRGGFVVLEIGEATKGESKVVAFDVGDTGTGTGMQAQ